VAFTFEAVYEGGVLKPAQPLPLKDQERVQVTITAQRSRLLDSYGIAGFHGTAEEADYFALDPELDFRPLKASTGL
jgi:predicted DNA-binding antitoxin AbrB/MazE fold protein